MTRPGDDEQLIGQARRLAEERRAAARRTRESDALARRVVEDAAGRPVMEHLRELADSCDLGVPVDGTLLWSHVCQVRRGRPVSNQDLAAAYAKDSRRRSAGPLPIHLTPGGAWFAKVLDNPSVRRRLISPDERAELWERLSRRFAGQARGRVLVFAASAHPQSYLYRHELPILRRNPAVGRRRIVFVHAVGGSAGGAPVSQVPVGSSGGGRSRAVSTPAAAVAVVSRRRAPGGSGLVKTVLGLDPL